MIKDIKLFTNQNLLERNELFNNIDKKRFFIIEREREERELFIDYLNR